MNGKWNLTLVGKDTEKDVSFFFFFKDKNMQKKDYGSLWKTNGSMVITPLKALL